MEKILVTAHLKGRGMDELKKRFNVTYPKEGRFTKEELLDIIAEYDGILMAGPGMDAKLMSAAKNLKIISVYGAGYDNIDIKEASRRGILVANAPESVREATAEINFGLMIDVMRAITKRDRWLRQSPGTSWGSLPYEGRSLYGKTLGIIGLGSIGKAVARRGLAFGMSIKYYNRNRLSREVENELRAEYLPMDELLKASDVISINTPLTAKTHGLIGKRELGLMKESAYLINTSRGKVVDETALIKALQQGEIAGAGLDVFEREPYVPEALLELENVVLTPHIGTATDEVREQMANEACQNILDFFSGITPKSAVNV
ncbi:MAG: dihydrofolate reductase [Clostridiales bacterium]|nr:dihydrofolate reductase [Clostridiales bacterium]